MNSRTSFKKSKIIIFILLLFTFLLPAYAMAEGATAKLSIAVIPERSDLDFWKLLKKGVTSAALEDGNIKIFWLTSLESGSFKEQSRQVEWCIQRNVDAVVISPVHAIKMKKPLVEAMHHGIPVIQMVSGISYGKTTSYVHSNNFEGGAIAAKFLGKKENGSGSVVLGLFARGNFSVNQRVKGFKAQLAKSASKLKIVRSIYVGEELGKGAAKIRVSMWETRAMHKSRKVNAIVGMNESSSETFLATLKNMKRLKGVDFVAFNPDQGMVQDIKDGFISAGVAQDPYEIGRIVVNQAAMAARGQEVPAETVTPVYLVTRENLAKPKILEVLGMKERSL